MFVDKVVAVSGKCSSSVLCFVSFVVLDDAIGLFGC
jgi:hypothetical protein